MFNISFIASKSPAPQAFDNADSGGAPGALAGRLEFLKGFLNYFIFLSNVTYNKIIGFQSPALYSD